MSLPELNNWIVPQYTVNSLMTCNQTSSSIIFSHLELVDSSGQTFAIEDWEISLVNSSFSWGVSRQYVLDVNVIADRLPSIVFCTG